MLAAIGALAAVAVTLRRHCDSTATLRVERGVGVSYLLLWVGSFVRSPWTSTRALACSCALGRGLRSLVLITGGRVWRSLAYMGDSLCAGLVTQLTEGRCDRSGFWAAHTMAVAVPLYDVLARDFRPTWHDFAGACVGAAAYVAVVLPIDLATGWNTVRRSVAARDRHDRRLRPGHRGCYTSLQSRWRRWRS
jgi:hypothetical protein